MNGELRVLIADDDSGMRMILRRLIEKAESFTLAGGGRRRQTGHRTGGDAAARRGFSGCGNA